MEINQVLPAISYGDAVSSDAIEIQGLLRDLGYTSQIYAKYIDPKCSQYARPLRQYNEDAKNILLYHFAIAGLDVTDKVIRLRDTKALIYHNITPPEYFLGYDVNMGYMCSKGRDELRAISGNFQLGIGDSEYNRLELEKFGFKNTEVLPIILNFIKYKDYDAELVNELLQDGNEKFLFVGRLAPNKRQEDIIKVFYHYVRYINDGAQLYLVGNKQISKYVLRLEDQIKDLGLSKKVILTGLIDNKKLAAYYKVSDIFISMSEHEGFCIPLLEAMSFGIPVIAYASAGIPYTVGDAGILLHKKNYIEIAELINIIMNDKVLSDKLAKKQYQRLKNFDKESIRLKIIELINNLTTMS